MEDGRLARPAGRGRPASITVFLAHTFVTRIDRPMGETFAPNKSADSTLLPKLKTLFAELYGAVPAIFRAPGRVNLIGEHTDYNDGFVMPAAINFYAYSAIAGRADRMLSIHSEQFGETVEFDLSQVAVPPRKHWSDYVRGVAAALRNEGYPLTGANLLIDGRVPIGSGLSS